MNDQANSPSAEQRAIHRLQMQRNTAMDQLVDALVTNDILATQLEDLKIRMPALEARLAAIEQKEASDGNVGIPGEQVRPDVAELRPERRSASGRRRTEHAKRDFGTERRGLSWGRRSTD